MTTNTKCLFEPWKGDQYGHKSMFKIPILIIGESNYTDNLKREEPHSTFTHRLIKSIINASWKHRFFSNIQRTFVENANTEESRKQFWHSVAHHEYIQDWLPSPGVAPTEEMWRNAKPIFQEVVAELKPKIILFVCKRTYVHMSPEFERGDLLKFDGDIRDVDRDTRKIQGALATYIFHPTRHGFRKSRGGVRNLIQISGGETWI